MAVNLMAIKLMVVTKITQYVVFCSFIVI